MDMLIFSGSPPKRNSLMVCVILNVGVWPAALVPFKCLPSLALWKQLSAKMTAALHRTIAGVSLQDGLTLFRDLALLVFYWKVWEGCTGSAGVSSWFYVLK